MKLSEINQVVEKHETSEIKINTFAEMMGIDEGIASAIRIEFEAEYVSRIVPLKYYSNINEFEKEIIENIQELETTYRL